ncbi:MAG: type IVB secretion system protein DotG/IcmE [Legionella sp.]
MAGKKENIKALFNNTRTRVIILFTAVLVFLTILIGVIRFTSSTSANLDNTASLSGPPTIQSIPGALNPTAQYASLVEEQNEQQAKKAVNGGGSAIPTIIRTHSFGGNVEAIGPQQGDGGLGFSTLSQEDSGGVQRTMWLQSLKDANCSRSSVKQVLEQGASMTDLRSVCSCVQLKDNGYSIKDLEPVCSCKELRSSGYNAVQLKTVGYSANKLKICGFSACELRNAGFSAQEMSDGGFSEGELQGAGFPDQQIKLAGGLPQGMSATDVNKRGCGINNLVKMRAAGVSAAAIRRISGCSAAELQAAHYSIQDLKNAGFTAADLKRLGYTPAQLKQAGYSARELLNAGFQPQALTAAGFTSQDIDIAGAELPPGVTPNEIKAANCDIAALKRERLAGVSAKLIRQYAGCSAAALSQAGYTSTELSGAGFTAQELSDATLNPSNQDIRAAACDPKKLKALMTHGVTAQKIVKLNGCDANTLKSAGFNAEQLAALANVADQLIRAAGCDPEKLKSLSLQGVSAKRIKDLNGCSAAALREAGYDAKALAAAGFSPKNLLDAGFSSQQLMDAGLGVAAVIASGRTTNCSVDSLVEARKMGTPASSIRQTLGCSLQAMKAAGYTASDLKNAGYLASELKKAGYYNKDIKAAGFSDKELNDANLNDAKVKKTDDLIGQSANKGIAPLPNNTNVSTSTPPSQLAVPPSMTSIPSLGAGGTGNELSNAKQLQEILNRQQSQMADQRYQQKLQQRTALMQSAASQVLQDSKVSAVQVYIGGSSEGKPAMTDSAQASVSALSANQPVMKQDHTGEKPFIKTGDVYFAVLDTAVNSDEPGPILATVVSGPLKGAKLIGSFTLPSNANKMVISFNTVSIPGASKSTAINAYAIDPNTARTALSTSTDHHYLTRYGSLFAATFLEGFGNAFQSANTTITIGGTGTATNTTVSSGVGRSLLENAVIGLATLGKSWGQTAQQQFTRPTTVQVNAGTGFGILFTQDLTSI